MRFIQRHHRILFYSCWLVLGLIQSLYTELQDDEAYYWVYGKFLDWGYFDHPPMIALLTKMGYAIFPNELGVRLFPLLLNTASLLIIEKLINKKNPALFYAIVLSIAVLQLTGFAAVPDTPLIFFSALFFLCYRYFLDRPSFITCLMLGLAMACLCYSKYHAVLVIFFTLLSNLRLFTRYHIYLAGGIAFILFAPHLWWQYEHDWMSFRYHLFESNVNAYKISFTLEYLLGQLLLPGPIAGLILLPAAILSRYTDAVQRALKFTMIGVYAFFLLSSFRGKVEANWTSPAIVPLIILSHSFLYDHAKWRLWLVRLLPVTLLLVLAARIMMLVDIVPLKAIKERYHSWQKWPYQMKMLTHDRLIVFSNSYQRASKYWFYSGQKTYSLNHYRERKNNYNLWPVEDSMLGKPFYFLDIYGMHRFPDSLKTPIGWVGYKPESALNSFAKIKAEITPTSIHAMPGQSFDLRCHFVVPPFYAAYINSHSIASETVRIGIFDSKEWIKDIPLSISLRRMTLRTDTTFTITPGLPKGTYYLRLAIASGDLNPTHNSDKIPLIVE